MTPGAAQFEEATFSEADLHGATYERIWCGVRRACQEPPSAATLARARSSVSAVGEGSLAIALVHQYLRETDATLASVVAATSSVSVQ